MTNLKNEDMGDNQQKKKLKVKDTKQPKII